MRWSRIKNIIILLLVIVNIFLLALVGVRVWRTQRGERETRERMLTVLANNGISFLPADVPGERDITARQLTPVMPGESQAAALVGTIRKTETLGNQTTYIGEKGQVSFSASGEIAAFFGDPNGTAPLSSRSAEDTPVNPADPTAAAREVLAMLGVEAQLREYVPAVPGEGINSSVFVQLWEGFPVPQCTLQVDCVGTEPVYLTGQALFGSSSAAGQEQMITAPTALTRFLQALNEGGYVCSKITNMYAGYVSTGTITVTLEPAWFIETDAWPWRFAVNGITGAVIPAE